MPRTKKETPSAARLAVLAGASGGGEFICADNVLGAEVARTQAIAAAEDPRHLSQRDGGQAFGGLHGLGEGGANVAAQRIVAGQSLVGPLQDDDVLLALERGDDGGLGEGANHIDVDGADAGPALLAQIIDCGLDVFGRRAERDKDRLRVVNLVLADKAVAAPGEQAELQ